MACVGGRNRSVAAMVTAGGGAAGTGPGVARERRRVRVTGTVQGVGFRPFVHRHAIALGLDGWVRNDSAGVLIEVEGEPAVLEQLTRAIRDEPPRLARVDAVEVRAGLAPLGVAGFHIAPTEAGGPATAPVGVDTATCAACLAEVDDPADRRYRYPFTNCTDCGPRYTIVQRVPYDRSATTMAGFTMCAACQAEYDDPSDRRFHAQPNACPACGPQLTWRCPTGEAIAVGDEALAATVDALRSGRIVALKGIGGYHLAVDAGSDAAVAELRHRKHRDDKPFAVMVPDMAAARRVGVVDAAALADLQGPGRPIVLVPRAGDGALAGGVAPGLAEVGLLLPYSPLHHLLLGAVARPLVMTSGNVSDEPIAHDDGDAVARLGPLVDGLLTHDRPIHIRCDDSVVRASPRRLQVLRRSRGLAPEPVRLPVAAARPILAVGAELKCTVAVARGGFVVASHHVGDLEHLATYESFLQAIDHLCHLYDVRPEVVAHDLHPEYLSSKLAADLDLSLVGVQHHHAHVASCLVEHGRTAPVLGLAFDGLGYGTDGTLWGGELLVADLERSARVGHLRPVAMPGGAAAIREP
ncbi:MAG: carbamoyltransferase HypF, partial [Acidimicrobiales bacterium]|nr:carbamoyltransferase HypF [Acidimicrobiales bacterium]